MRLRPFAKRRRVSANGRSLMAQCCTCITQYHVQNSLNQVILNNYTNIFHELIAVLVYSDTDTDERNAFHCVWFLRRYWPSTNVLRIFFYYSFNTFCYNIFIFDQMYNYKQAKSKLIIGEFQHFPTHICLLWDWFTLDQTELAIDFVQQR